MADESALLVEDEGLIAMVMQDALEDLGWPSTWVTSTRAALDALATRNFSFAILDVNLDGETSYPVAEALAVKGVPYFFSSGYGSAGVQEKYRSLLLLRKPFTAAALHEVVRSIEDILQTKGKTNQNLQP
jgi:CheY-like chemotaxis protein